MEERKRISAGELVVGLGLIGLGGLFILGQIFRVDFWNLIWPIFVMLPGLVFFAVMLIGSRNLAPFAIPGSIITTTGLVLFYQNMTGHWESWAYIWALIAPTSVGVGLWLAGTRSENPSLREAGSTVVVMAHRPSVLVETSKVLILHQGKVAKFGRREEIFRMAMQSVPSQPTPVETRQVG